MRKVFVLVVLVLTISPLQAQEPRLACDDDQKPITCFQELWNQDLREVVNDTGIAAVDEQVRAKTTPNTGGTESTGSLRNFLPLFLGDLGLGGFEQDDEGALSFSFNPWSPFRPDSSSDWEISTRLGKAQLYAPLVAQFPEDDRDRLENVLEERIGEMDDLEIALTWNLRTATFGRDPQKHDDLYDLFGDMVRVTSGNAPPAALQELVTELGAMPGNPDTQTFGQMPAAQRARVERLVIDAAREAAGIDDKIERLISETNYLGIPDLINNQPQFNVEASYRTRDPLVGPDEISGQFTFEYGLLNVNHLRGTCDDRTKVTLDCMRKYREKYGTAIDMAPRITVKAEYTEIDSFQFVDADENLDITLPAGESIKASLSFGSYVRGLTEGAREGRMEVEASYEDVSGDTMKNDRFVATGTYIQELSDDTSLSFSLVYANKPEYLGEVDEELGTRFGLRYKFDKGDD